MRRKNLFKTLITLTALTWSVIVLMPTYMLHQQKQEADKFYSTIEENTTLKRNDIKAALSSGNLELRVRNTFKGTNENSINALIEEVNSLTELNEKIEANELKSIKRGLDLQGGTYLVYEVDLPKMLETLAKERDSALDAGLRKTVVRVRKTNDDFFDALLEVCREDSLRLSRYFGRSRDSNEDIVSKLKEEAEDAVDRTLSVLDKRIDQFGVSEPSITKQGDRRIVIELAGIQDVERAKNLIGTTAQLKFQLETEADIVSAVLSQINRAMKRQMAGGGQEEAEGDSMPVQQKLRKDTERRVDDLFGAVGASIINESSDTENSGGDSIVVVDEEIFQDRPFDALLANIGGDIGVPVKNLRTVERILNSPEVQKVIPKDGEFLFSAKTVQIGEQSFYRMFMLKKDAEVKGSMIKDAQMQIGSQLSAGQAEVSMDFNGEGARIFAKLTGANIGKRLAIVLDGKIVSIPNIESKIPNGRARITGMADRKEATDLAIVLRAGALPAPIEVIEERTVGPSLGQDSITSGTTSALVGFAIVIIFMVVYYRLSGLIADVALLMNLTVIMAVLAGFHATLTLPGVAGIILTIGMAVDANVLIFERIREELRSGKTIRAAIDNGYARAFKTILDANLTTFISALVLYQFGTGPIRGFALTLSIGILVSMFTAIVVTRIIFDYFTNKFSLSKLSI